MNPLSLLFKKQYAVEEKVQRLLRFLEDIAHLYQAAYEACLLYTSPSPRDRSLSRMPSSA